MVAENDKEIRVLCHDHTQDFVGSFEDARTGRDQTRSLIKWVRSLNSEILDTGERLLERERCLTEQRNILHNLDRCVAYMNRSLDLLALYQQICALVHHERYVDALKAIKHLEMDFLTDANLGSLTFVTMIRDQLPDLKSGIQRRVTVQFNNWLVRVRECSQDIGSLALKYEARRQPNLASGSFASAAARMPSGKRTDRARVEPEPSIFDALGISLTPPYRCMAVNEALDAGAEFRSYYHHGRKVQAGLDLKMLNEAEHLSQDAFLQILGFFVVEETMLRTAGTLVSRAEVDALWEAAAFNIKVYLQQKFSFISDTNVLSRMKDFLLLLASCLTRYGYDATPILDFLQTSFFRFRDVIMQGIGAQITQSLSSDPYSVLCIDTPQSYEELITANQLNTSDELPDFPVTFPFSRSVPECFLLVKEFIATTYQYIHGLSDFQDLVRDATDMLLKDGLMKYITEVLNHEESITAVIQITVNLSYFQEGCVHFEEFASALQRKSQRIRLTSRAEFRSMYGVAGQILWRLMKESSEAKLNTWITNWTPVSPAHSSQAVAELIRDFRVLLDSSLNYLPSSFRDRFILNSLVQIALTMKNALTSESVKKFNLFAILGVEKDLRLLEEFAQTLPAENSAESFLELRQIVGYLLCGRAEDILDTEIRTQRYLNIYPPDLVLILEKYKEVGTVVHMMHKQSLPTQPKRRAVEAVLRKLRELIRDNAI